jgi:hypothetical protein
MGYLCGGWLLTKSASIALDQLAKDGTDSDYLNGKITCARFYVEQLLPRVHAHFAALKSGGATVMALTEEQF